MPFSLETKTPSGVLDRDTTDPGRSVPRRSPGVFTVERSTR
jgi:hypothetical protein